MCGVSFLLFRCWCRGVMVVWFRLHCVCFFCVFLCCVLCLVCLCLFVSYSNEFSCACVVYGVLLFIVCLCCCCCFFLRFLFFSVRFRFFCLCQSFPMISCVFQLFPKVVVSFSHIFKQSFDTCVTNRMHPRSPKDGPKSGPKTIQDAKKQNENI